VFASTVLLSALPCQAQDVSFLLCPEVHFYDETCAPPALPGMLEPPSPPPPPLFPPETLARDTPPLMRQLLDAPTVENARAFLAWQAERQARILEVQTLLHSLVPTPRTPPER